MELRQLKYFLAVADARSIVGAAGMLFISRQAVSKAIAQLELEMGVELFVRDSNGVYLTSAGRTFYNRICSNVMELEAALQEMQGRRGEHQQRARVAFSVGATQIYEAALREFCVERKMLELEIVEYSEAQCRPLLLEHEVDIAICAADWKDTGSTSTLLGQFPYALLGRTRLNRARGITPGDLRRLPLAGISDGQTRRFCQKYGLTLRYTGCDLYRLFSLAAAGQCEMLLPAVLVPRDWPGLSWIPVQGSDMWQVYCFVAQGLENSTLCREICDCLRMQSLAYLP